MEPVASPSQPIESASATTSDGHSDDENGAIAIIEDSEPIVKKSRKTYSVQFKMNALEKLKQVRANGENDADFVANLGVDKSILSRWKKDEKKIAEAAANRGRRVSHSWIWCNARKIVRELTGDPE